MKLELIATVLVLAGMTMAQDGKPNTAELAAAGGVTPCIGAAVDATSRKRRFAFFATRG
jgi:hypothetical protein